MHLRHPSQPSHRAQVLAVVEKVSNKTDEDKDTDNDSDANDDDDTEPSATARAFTKGTQRTLSFEDLPLWIQPHYTRSIEPTLIAHAGSLDNPWKLDYGLDEPVNTFGDVLNKAYSALCEELAMPVTVLSNKDVLWRYVCPAFQSSHVT